LSKTKGALALFLIELRVFLRSGKALKVHFFTFKLKKLRLIDNNNRHAKIISETSLLELSEITISAD